MRQMRKWGTAALLGAAFALGACGGGGNDTASGTDTAGTAAGEVAAGGPMGGTSDSGAMAGTGGAPSELAALSAPDMMAVIGASNAAEIATSEVAVERARNADVKAFARRMVDEHQTMQGQADQLATRLNVTPGTPQRAQEKVEMANQMAQQLRTLAVGDAFDRQYIDGQVLAHQQTLAELQAMQNTSNADIRTLITQAIPKVQAHLQEAQQIQSRLGGNTGATGGAAGGAGTTPATGTPPATGTTPSGR
jgi:putative membrane protein